MQGTIPDLRKEKKKEKITLSRVLPCMVMYEPYIGGT